MNTLPSITGELQVVPTPRSSTAVMEGIVRSNSSSSSSDHQLQKYPAEPFEIEEGAAERPSCGTRFAKCVSNIIPYGGLVSNSFNLASATLGAGILSLPGGFKASGMVVSSVLIVVVCFFTVYSIRLLAIATEKTGFRSYEEMARGLLGRGVDYFTAFLMFVFCFGTCIGYVISVGDLLSPLLNDPSVPAYLQTDGGKRCLQSLVWLVGMLTLSLPKEINSLRYASFIGVSCIIFFVICMIIHAARNGLKDGIRSDIEMKTTGINAVNGLSLFIFAFICQVNCFEIYTEMQDPTPARMTRDSGISMSVVALLYFLSGFFGYADFGSEIESSVLSLYDPRHDYLMAVSFVGIAIKLCVGFAICMQPSRDAIYYVIGWGKTSDVATWKNLLISTFLCVVALVLGLFIPNISVVFSLLGGLCGGFLAFLFPAYFIMYSGDWTLKKVGIVNFVLTYILIIGGVVALVFGTAASIYGEAMG